MSATLEKTETPGIYKRGARFVVIFRDPMGRQRKRSARNLTEARKLKAALTADVERGEYRELSRVTFAEYVTQWISTYGGRTSRGVRPETIADYRKTLERDAIEYFGRTRLAAISPQHVKAYAAQLSARGLAANTVRLKLAPVRALLATAFEEGLIRSNPATGVRISTPTAESVDDEERVKALSEEQLRALLAEIPEAWRLFFEFLAHSGCRIGEAVALQWKHVDPDRQRVMIRRRYYKGGFAPPKSRYGRRDIPLSPGMAAALRTLRAGRSDETLVFSSSAGTIIDATNLAPRVLKPAAVRAGLGEWVVCRGRKLARTWVSFHTFRHTAASMLFRAGLNAKQVQAWLGHHSPAFTLATYIHLLDSDMPDADFLDVLTALPRGQQGATEPAETGGDEQPRLRAVSAA